MKIHVAACLSLLVFCAIRCFAADNSSSNELGIRKTIDQYEQGWNAHNGHMLAMCFTEDADFINIFGGRLKGREAIEEMLTAAHGQGPAATFRNSTMHFTIDKITFLAPDAAVVIVKFPLVLSGSPNPAEGRVGEFEFAFTNGQHVGLRVMRKVGSRWLIQTFENTKILDKSLLDSIR